MDVNITGDNLGDGSSDGSDADVTGDQLGVGGSPRGEGALAGHLCTDA